MEDTHPVKVLFLPWHRSSEDFSLRSACDLKETNVLSKHPYKGDFTLICNIHAFTFHYLYDINIYHQIGFLKHSDHVEPLYGH